MKQAGQAGQDVEMLLVCLAGYQQGKQQVHGLIVGRIEIDGLLEGEQGSQWLGHSSTRQWG